ncbi:ribonuclease H-like YkuK family protein [Candidatus Roizmanbacteria bacterium]|nr:ribonuclease H-like YkuK family protein [Candidatus Roizmanbacteria bacterium]
MTIYHSITYGDVPLTLLRNHIIAFMRSYQEVRYQVIIGTDSQVKNGGTTDFVTAIIVHRVGRGGIYFWRRIIDRKKRVLKQRIFEETTYSLTTAQELLEEFKKNGISGLDFVIHVDIGKNGPTRVLISEVVSMIRSSGFAVKTKPESFGASKVADRHT